RRHRSATAHRGAGAVVLPAGSAASGAVDREVPARPRLDQAPDQRFLAPAAPGEGGDQALRRLRLGARDGGAGPGEPQRPARRARLRLARRARVRGLGARAVEISELARGLTAAEPEPELVPLAPRLAAHPHPASRAEVGLELFERGLGARVLA